MSLIKVLLPVLLKPVDQLLEWHMMLIMEEEALRATLYELLHNLFFGHVAKHDMLGIVW